MVKKSRSIPRPLKELAIAEYMRDYFGVHSTFPSNEEIVDCLRNEFADEDVGPLYPKDITNLKKGAYRLLDISVSLPRSGTLEVELREALDLDGAVVVGSPYKSYDANILRNIIGYQAARFFDENVKDGETVTLSSSMTIREMIKRIHERFSNLQILTDSVIAVDKFHVMSPAALVVLFLDRFPSCRGTAYTLAPSLVDELGRGKVQEKLDEALFKRAFSAHWVFVGIGALSQELASVGVTPGFDFLTHVVTKDAEPLRERGTVAEISYWPIDAGGRPVYRGEEEDLDYFNHVFTYSDFPALAREHRARSGSQTRVVGAAGGLHKVGAIKAAAPFLDYLVTDVKTAAEILK